MHVLSIRGLKGILIFTVAVFVSASSLFSQDWATSEIKNLHRLDLRNLGYKKSIIPWVGPIGFYFKEVGAEVERVFWNYRKEIE